MYAIFDIVKNCSIKTFWSSGYHGNYDELELGVVTDFILL